MMEKKGYIARESVGHDARLKRVVLTEKKELLFSPCQHQSILSFIGELKECLVKC